MMIWCRMAVKRMGMLGVSVRKMKALTVKMEKVTLIGKGRQNVTCCVFNKCMQFVVKYFPLADVLFLQGHLRLESSCIWVNAVLHYFRLHLYSRWSFSPQNFRAIVILPVHTVY